MTFVGEPFRDSDVTTRQYVHKLNKDVIKALQRSIDIASSDWLELYGEVTNAVNELNERFKELDKAL